MGMDLSGAGGYSRWSNSGWANLLSLGEEFGWVPAGTGPPRGVLKAEWGGGGYGSNDGQLFYARDAQALADALARALVAIPERQPPKRGAFKGRYFTPEQVQNYREFIEYCRAGSFRIF